MDALGPLPEGVELMHKAEGTFDFAQLFVKSVAELESLAPTVIRALKDDGVFWVCYPKKSAKFETDISRDVGWGIMRENGFRPVTAVSIDQFWSALRFRSHERVGR